MGVDPHPWTLRDLITATLAKQSSDWDHTAQICCLMANINSSKKKFKPADFHPYRKGKSTKGSGGIPINKSNIQLLRIFCGKRTTPNGEGSR